MFRIFQKILTEILRQVRFTNPTSSDEKARIKKIYL